MDLSLTVGGDLARRSQRKPAVGQAEFMNENRKNGLRQSWKEKTGKQASVRDVNIGPVG